jgi:hypothetical protein
MSTNKMSFTAPPTVSAFMNSDAFVRIILGPVGSGKSTGCLMEIVRRAAQQVPGPDGMRRTRFAIVRQTLQQIKQTILKEFYTWVDPITTFKVSENTIYLSFDDVRSEIHLIPLDDEQDQRRLLSLQLTGAWINEFPEIDPAIIPSLCGRLGRYPSTAQGGATWFGLIMDGNFPNEGGDWHNLLENSLPPDYQLFKQPGGRTPEAENLENLKGGVEYYNRLARGQSPEWVKRYVDAQYGNDPSGMAVFRESFTSDFHVIQTPIGASRALYPIPGRPLLIGQDFGRDPWSVICQFDHRGRFLVLEEIEGTDLGLEQHILLNLRPRLMSRDYMNMPIAVIGDPSGVSKSSLYEETSFDMLKREGFMAFPAPTNDLEPRLRAVEAFLMGQQGGKPVFMVDADKCPTIVQGLRGGYRFSKMKGGQRKPTPDKNKYSHPMDALQYAALAAHGGMVQGAIMRRLQRPLAPSKPAFTAKAWT